MSVASKLITIAENLQAKLDAINVKLTTKGQTEAANLNEVPDKIEAIKTGADVSGVTATADDVIEGKVIVDSEGAELIGTIPEKNSNDITVLGTTVTIPAGRYKSDVEKTVESSNSYCANFEVGTGTSDMDVKIAREELPSSFVIAAGHSSGNIDSYAITTVIGNSYGNDMYDLDIRTFYQGSFDLNINKSDCTITKVSNGTKTTYYMQLPIEGLSYTYIFSTNVGYTTVSMYE